MGITEKIRNVLTTHKDHEENDANMDLSEDHYGMIIRGSANVFNCVEGCNMHTIDGETFDMFDGKI